MLLRLVDHYAVAARCSAEESRLCPAERRARAAMLRPRPNVTAGLEGPAVTSGGFVRGGDRNIIANGFINPTEGNVKLYKSKKRLELRLNPEVITSPHTVTLWSLNPAVAPVVEPLA